MYCRPVTPLATMCIRYEMWQNRSSTKICTRNKIVKTAGTISTPHKCNTTAKGLCLEYTKSCLFARLFDTHYPVLVMCQRVVCHWSLFEYFQVVYVTAPLPYILLTLILVRAVTLPGALQGIIYYVKPDFSRLADFQVGVFIVIISFSLTDSC